MRKAQFAVEYILVLAMMLMVTVPLAYYHFAHTRETYDDTMQAKTDELAKDIVDTAQNIYYSPGIAKRTIDLRMPLIITNISLERRRVLIFTLSTDAGIVHKRFESNVPLAIQITPADISVGKFTIEKINNVAVICTQRCRCDDNETALNPTCDDRVDNDCDGFVDMCDNDCVVPVIAGNFDNDNDLWTTLCRLPDCNDTVAQIHPNAYDICGNGIDEDCDGSDSIC